jgi:hypothetical protein
LDLFGAANSWFEAVGKWNLKSIATAEGKLAGMIFGRQTFCVPSQIPEATRDKIAEPNPRTKEFFELLTDGLVSVVRKQAVAIPEWADAYKFDKERDALARKDTITEEMSRLEAEIDSFRRCKWILINDGDDLVDAVKHVLETGFGFRVESVEEFREDMKLLGEDNKPLLFVEVKGTNRGVKREHVNQADSHRERSGLAPTFPSILIMNTSIKNARSLAEKDEPVASEQVEHAKRHNILILRTLDLLRLMGLHSRGAITSAEVQGLLTTGAGWLKGTDDERFEVVES